MPAPTPTEAATFVHDIDLAAIETNLRVLPETRAVHHMLHLLDTLAKELVQVKVENPDPPPG